MLSAQIPSSLLSRISADLNLSLGIFNVTLKEKENQHTRFDKLKVVANYIENHLDIGDVDHPKSSSIFNFEDAAHNIKLYRNINESEK